MKNIPPFKQFIQWFEASNNAIEGILTATKYQKHIKFHLFAAFFILFFCFMIGIEKGEFISITIIILLVIISEMFNSSIEAIVDSKTEEKREWARIAKDIAAGAVLVSSIGALIVGYLILWPYILDMFTFGFQITKHQPENIAVLALTMVMLLIIGIKAYFGGGQPLRGGFPSGHSALSFSLWISIVKATHYPMVIYIGLALALLVSFHRLIRKVHSFWDILIGAILGSTLTIFLFWIFQ